MPDLDRDTLDKMRDTARGLVVRARAGDQNARDQIGEIGKYARSRRPRAMLAFRMIREYMDAHPYKDAGVAEFGTEEGLYRGDLHRNIGHVVASARKGEAWAVKLLASIRERADKGVFRARVLWNAFRLYMKANSVFHGERPRDIDVSYPESGFRFVPCQDGIACLVVCFAHGPILRTSRIADLADTFAAELEARMFLYGIDHAQDEGVMAWDLPNRAKACVVVGQAVGTARAIQAVRGGRASLSVLDAGVAKELGGGT